MDTGSYPLNNLNKSDYSKKSPPHILRNLTSEENCVKNYDKERIGNLQGVTKPVGRLVSVEDSTDGKYTRRRKVKRVVCYVAWLFCCPCMLVGLSRRETADCDDPDDLKDDPCVPCSYDPYFDPRNR